MEVEAMGKACVSLAQSPPPTAPAVLETAARAGAATPSRKPEESVKVKADEAAAALERAKVDREQFKVLLDKLNIVMNALEIQMKFSIHEGTRQVMVRVINVESGKVIREIPPERVLDMTAKMMEMVGLLLDERV